MGWDGVWKVRGEYMTGGRDLSMQTSGTGLGGAGQRTVVVAAGSG